MMKDVIRDLSTGVLPIVGILAFVTAFLLILVRVMLMSKSDIEYDENLPLQDDLDVR